MTVWLRVLRGITDVAGMGLVLIGVLTMCDVVLRKFFGISIRGSFVYVEVALVAVVLLPLAMVQYVNKHIRVEFPSDRVTGKGATVLQALYNVAGFVFFAALVWGGAGDLALSWRTGEIDREIGLPMVVPRGFMLLGGALMLLELLRGLYCNVRLLFPLPRSK